MKWFVFIMSLTVLLSCKQTKSLSEISTPSLENSAQQATETLPVKEAIFLTMERTPCFGRCPHYKITIFNTGKVVYEGILFTEKEGKYTKTLSTKQLTNIQRQMGKIKLFDMKDKYDSHITDIPAVALFVLYKNKKKKIYDRDGAPKTLTQFEKLIDDIIIDDELVKLEIRD